MASNFLNTTIPLSSSTPPGSIINIPVFSGNDCSTRSQWLRAAVLGANDGLVSVSSLMIGVGAVNQSSRTMLISGFAGLIAGAFSMAIGEFVSVYAQYDFESAQLKKDNNYNNERLPNPWKAAAASAIAFSIGALLPLLAGGFIGSWVARMVVVVVVSSIGLIIFGATGAVMGGATMGKAAVRVLVGGWIAMVVTYGVLRLFGLAFDVSV